MELINPFGPVIAKIIIPKDLLEKLNDHVDMIASGNEKKVSHGKYLAGNVSEELKISGDFGFSSGWFEFLGKNVEEYVIKTLFKKITKCKILNSWIVRQFSHEYNPIHWHGGHISGAGWLKVPKFWGEYYNFEKKQKDNPNGCLELIHGAKMFLNKSIFRVIPKVGDFYLFPNYLMHCVYPFNNINNEERRSISFNAEVDEAIYDVYKS